MKRGAPERLLQLDEVADAVFGLARDESLFGRVLVWWSDALPGLISWRDPGVWGVGGDWPNALLKKAFGPQMNADGRR